MAFLSPEDIHLRASKRVEKDGLRIGDSGEGHSKNVTTFNVSGENVLGY